MSQYSIMSHAYFSTGGYLRYPDIVMFLSKMIGQLFCFNTFKRIHLRRQFQVQTVHFYQLYKQLNYLYLLLTLYVERKWLWFDHDFEMHFEYYENKPITFWNCGEWWGPTVVLIIQHQVWFHLIITNKI